jgi:anti-sigma B factor antagonist
MITATRLNVRVETLGEGLVVRLDGDLDAETAEGLRNVVEAIGDPTIDLTLDFSGVTFLDSAGLSALIRAYKRSIEGGSQLVIVSPPPSVARALQIAGLDRLFTLA